MKRTNSVVKAASAGKSRNALQNKMTEASRKEVFENMLRKTYWRENELAQMLPKMAEIASSYELTVAILVHLAVTENQIIRLVHIFDIIGIPAGANSCETMHDIISEKGISENAPGYYRDCEIIALSQEIMRLEVDCYAQLHEHATLLREELTAEFLATAVKEEKYAYRTLSEISLSSIYFDAAG